MDAFLPKLSAIAIVVATCLQTQTLQANPIEITLDYSNTTGATIYFDGASHFSFAPNFDNLKITSGAAATGLLGEMTGTYSIGAVTKVGSVSSAPVIGSGTLVIHDGLGFDMAGTLTWVNIVQVGTSDFLNTSGNLNLTNISYHGTNSVLLSLAAVPSNASDVLSFQFTPAKSLNILKANRTNTSFSGTIHATRLVPENADSLLLLGLALAALALYRRVLPA